MNLCFAVSDSIIDYQNSSLKIKIAILTDIDIQALKRLFKHLMNQVALFKFRPLNVSIKSHQIEKNHFRRFIFRFDDEWSRCLNNDLTLQYNIKDVSFIVKFKDCITHLFLYELQLLKQILHRLRFQSLFALFKELIWHEKLFQFLQFYQGTLI